MRFIWPRKVLQTLILSFEWFLLNSSQLKQTALWNMSRQSSTDLELFPLERDGPLSTSVGSSHWGLSGRWGTAVAAGAYGDASHQEQTSASWLWSWEWPDPLSHCQGVLPSTWQFIVLAVKSAVPCFLHWKKRPKGCQLDSTIMLYFLHTLKLLSDNASAKWVLY